MIESSRQIEWITLPVGETESSLSSPKVRRATSLSDAAPAEITDGFSCSAAGTDLALLPSIRERFEKLHQRSKFIKTFFITPLFIPLESYIFS